MNDYDDDRDDEDLIESEPPAPRVLSTQIPIGRHDFENLSGTAGTGKTTIAKALIAQEPRGSILLAATTGIAAVNLGEGTTINAALRYFDTQSLKERYTSGQLQAIIRKHRKAGVRRILLDEKSMMNGDQLTYISRAMREVNDGKVEGLESIGAGGDDAISVQEERSLPPIGLSLIGDFGQLPPVPDKDPSTGKNLPLKFAFDSPEWPLYAEHTTTLTKIWRQDNQAFVNALHAVRRADIRAALAYFTPQHFVTTMDDTFDGTTIFAKNDEVDRYNLLRMDGLTGSRMTSTAVRVGQQRGDWKQIPDTLALKEGALVMILANRRQYEDEEDGIGRIVYANGDLGTLREKGENGAWRVTLHRNGATVLVYPIIRKNLIPLEPGRRKELLQGLADQVRKEYQDSITAQAAGLDPAPASGAITVVVEGARDLLTMPTDAIIDGIARVRLDSVVEDKCEIVGTITYMPLRAAYGCTVHKTQGLTLDKVQINIRDPFFRHPGMLFVALSRARTMENLRIIGNQTSFIERCRCEPRVQPWL